MINIVYAIDLSDYPNMFIKDDKLDAYLVVGDAAPAEDVISISTIAVSLRFKETEASTSGPIIVQKIDVETTKLASEVEDLFNFNIISAGTPCDNSVTAQLMGNLENCTEGLTEGVGLIKMYNHNGYWQIVVTGYSTQDARNAARVLSNFQEYDLKGTEIEVTKNSQGEFELKYRNYVKKDLSDFPDMFIRRGTLNSIMVVGNNAPATDVIAQTELALFFGSYLEKPVTGYTKLSSEITNLNQNLILIGGPCNNPLTSEIMDEPEPCGKYAEKGKAVIRLFDYNGNVHMVIMDYNDKGTREAVNVLKDYKDYSLSGDRFVIDIEEEVEEIEEVKEINETELEEEKQRIIEKLNKKISGEAEEESEVVEEEEIEIKQEKLEIITEEEGFIKKIIAWFLSLFGK